AVVGGSFVWWWTRQVRSRSAGRSLNLLDARSLWLGGLTAILLWLDPSVILLSHAWPQGDIRPIRPYLGPAWGAAPGRSGRAGLLIAIAAMLKGQVLLLAPLMPLWALFAGDWRGAGRFVLGVLLGMEILASFWLVRTPQAGAVLAFALALWALLQRPRWRAI